MARTGTQFAKITGNFTNANIYATWQLRSTDTTNKIFKIRLREYLTISGNATYESSSSTFKLNGTTIKSGSYSYTKGDHLLGYKDIDVEALADGSFPDTEISVYAKSFHFPATTETATLTSDDIPRMELGSSITDITTTFEYPAVGMIEGVLINAELLEEYTTKLKATLNGTTYNLLDNVTTPEISVYFDEGTYNDNQADDGDDSVLFPLSNLQIAQLIPNDRQINITFTLDTYEGDVKKGTFSKDYVFEITTASFGVTPTLQNDVNTNSLTGKNNYFIANYSVGTVKPNVTYSNNGATVSKYIFTRINGDATSSTTTTNDFYEYNNLKLNDNFTITIVDSRGFEQTTEPLVIDNINYIFLDYFVPQFTNVEIERPEQTANFVNLDLQGSFWNQSFGSVQNAITLKYRFKLSNETDYKPWVTITPTISENLFNYNNSVKNISADLSATFEIELSDKTGSVDLRTNFTIPKGKSMYDWGENYFSWNGELCINDDEVPCFQEDSVEADGSRNVTLYDSEGNKLNVATPVKGEVDAYTKAQSDAKYVQKETGKGLSTNDFTNTYKTNVDSNTSARHTHSNKTVLDGITSANITSWNNKSDFSGSYNDLKEKPTIPTVPTQVSAFTNDAGYLTSIPSEYITETELASKKYLTSVPSEYVTDSELNDKGYLTEHQPIKTVNGQTLIGSGDITIEGGSSVTELTSNFNVWELESGIYYVAPNVTMTNYTMFYDALSSLGVSADTSMSTIKIQLAKAFLIVHNYFEGMGMVEFTLFMMGEAPTVISGMTMYQEGIAMGGTIIGGDFMLSNKLQNYQEKLVSGTNIKTVNGTSLLGSGNITIEGGSSGGGIETLSGSARLWNLSQGVYLIAPSTTIQYYGATGSSSFTLSGGGVLSISDGNGSYKGFQIVTGEGAEAYIYLGATSSTYGFYAKLSRVNLQNAKACTYASSQNAVGYYNATGNVSSLNTTMYLQPNEWSITISNTTTGAPSSITGSTKVYLSVKAPGFAGSGLSSSLMPYLRQDMYAPSLNKHWYRIINYSDSSNVDYGEWVEIKETVDCTVYNVTGDATSVSSATNKTIATLKIPAGTYIINAHVSFAANTTGVRKIYIGTTENSYANTRALADTRPASNHQATMSNISTVLNPETDTTYYLNVYQNSGSSLNCSGSLRAVRIGNYAEYKAGL